MKDRNSFRRSALLLLVIAVALITTACPKKNDPGTYVTVSNNSGAPLRNLELTFKGGSFGRSLLGKDESHRHWIQTGAPCHVFMSFEDSTGRQVPGKELDLGEKCPPELALDIDAQQNVTGRAIQR
ncbi:MAG TPA: hypothetical protein VN622_14915 [Clostridia bacterium]|nr:hypothetical protein [Clostridia bacterium]